MSRVGLTGLKPRSRQVVPSGGPGRACSFPFPASRLLLPVAEGPSLSKAGSVAASLWFLSHDGPCDHIDPPG